MEKPPRSLSTFSGNRININLGSKLTWNKHKERPKRQPRETPAAPSTRIKGLRAQGSDRKKERKQQSIPWQQQQQQQYFMSTYSSANGGSFGSMDVDDKRDGKSERIWSIPGEGHTKCQKRPNQPARMVPRTLTLGDTLPYKNDSWYVSNTWSLASTRFRRC